MPFSKRTFHRHIFSSPESHGSDLVTPTFGAGTYWSGMLTLVRIGVAREAAGEIYAGSSAVELFDE